MNDNSSKNIMIISIVKMVAPLIKSGEGFLIKQKRKSLENNPKLNKWKKSYFESSKHNEDTDSEEGCSPLQK